VKTFSQICVLFGGSSHEREISIRSGTAVADALTRCGFEVSQLDARNGWREKLKQKKPDAVFVALHGSGGEDGEVQKTLDNLGIPYVGSGPAASLDAFDKLRSKKIFEKESIPTPPWILMTQKNWKKKITELAIPLFIKPVADGSSIGVELIESTEELEPIIQKSIDEYQAVIAERAIQGREFTVGIIGDQALPVLEVRPKRRFYDYTAKYTKGLTDYLVPAPIDENLAMQLQALALKTHAALGLRDFSRVDLIVDLAGNAYVLEANSIPGFTETSLLPKAAQAVGIGFDELCAKLVDLTYQRSVGKVYA